MVVYKLKKRRESYKPQLMGLWKNLFFIFWSHFSLPLETCNSTLRKSPNLFKSHFPSVKLGMIKILPCSSEGLSYCYQNILQRGSYSCGNSRLRCWVWAIVSVSKKHFGNYQEGRFRGLLYPTGKAKNVWFLQEPQTDIFADLIRALLSKARCTCERLVAGREGNTCRILAKEHGL